ncbi:hypothetical protein B1C78_03705 [Thioalkalivibrio denitrificans]|uniref:PEP-CTERM protein-sorting domain-containing protein n=1 Tax=Thioalkalivibrio denitrificans TaxID=108003 RepID=A0A1V3NQL6_9GAMM|nr:PEP-CTERM sorting domain-containing protein [Thioalkalivibrio denitrificans]OOG27253.1 hypothetical protein B1C78_03705 [Thioalkalivibrio denitrificans]
MIKKLVVAAALGTLMSTGTAFGSAFQINVGYDATGDGSTLTGVIEELGYTGTRATSIYLGDPSVAGTQIIDTNIDSVMDSYGFSAGSHTTVGGTTVSFNYPLDPQQKNISALNFLGAGEGNGFTDGVIVPYGATAPNDGVFWGITYDYNIQGQITATGLEFTSGSFDVYFENGTDRIQVLRLDVTGSQLDPANLYLTGPISYDFAGADDAFVQNFFVDVASGMTFYELWAAGEDTKLGINWILDTNIDPPIPTLDQLVAFTYDDDQTALFRQTNLDGSVTFQVVPEPMMLTLFGAGLLALGFAARRRRNQT